MKRLSSSFWLLFIARCVWAQGTVQQSFQQIGNTNEYVLAMNWTGDSVSGAVPSTAAVIPSVVQGLRVFAAEFSPGTPAPSNPYTVTITTAIGVDILNGGASRLSSTVASSVAPSSSIPPVNGTLTINITNSIRSAQGSILIYFAPISQVVGLPPTSVSPSIVDANSLSSAWYIVDTGTPNSIVGSPLTTFPPFYATGQCVVVKMAATNTGPATINIRSLGPKPVSKNGAGGLANGDLVLGQEYMMCYDGTQFQVITLGTGGGGGGTVDANAVKNAIYCPDTSGAANTVTCATTTIFPVAYTAGQAIVVKLANTVTGAATVNVNSLGAKNITKNGTTALASGDLVAGGLYVFTYDGVEFVVTQNLGVSSVSFTGGLISVATPTTTPALTVAGTSGGIPYFSGASTWASSAALTANLPVFGGGAGTAPFAGTRTGNTTLAVTGSGAYTNGHGLVIDANGNVIDSGSPPVDANSVKNAIYCPDTSGAANTITCTTTTTFPAAYATGQHIVVKVANSVSGATTININSLGAKNVTKNGTVALAANDLVAGGIYTVTYDGTEFVVTQNLGAGGGGGGSALSSITAATASNTIASGNNPQTWNCAQTSDTQDCMTFGESAAATGGTLTNGLANQAILHASTASASTATPLEIDQGSITATTGPPLLQLETTWNNASLVGEGILLNATNTSSAAASKLLDLRVGNTAQFTADKSGNAVATTSFQTTASAPGCTAGTAGFWCATEGTAFTNIGGASGIYPDSTAHEFLAKTNGASGAGTMVRSQPSPVSLTGQTATIASGTSLCSQAAGSCSVAGLYRASFYVASTVSCATPGSAAIGPITVTYTDDAGTKTAQTVPMSINGGASLSVGTMALGNATNSMSGSTTMWSTGAAQIGYGVTGYVACTSGTATYSVRAAVERIF